MRELVKEKSETIEYFLERSHLDHATTDMLLRYKKNGGDHFSKDEVLAIIVDLREAMETNKILGTSVKTFRRAVLGVAIFSFLLFVSVFSLSYSVAVLNKNTYVRSNGVMTTRDGSRFIATDSHATVFSVDANENGAHCLGDDELETLTSSVSAGRSVLLKLGGVEGESETVALRAGGMDVEESTGKVCFWNYVKRRQECVETDDRCVSRRLIVDELGHREMQVAGNCFCCSCY